MGRSNKFLIIGHGRHGKDTLAEYWNEEFGFTYKSSSLAAAEIFIFDMLKDKLGYETVEQCYEDRVNHRSLWYELIKAYNYNDKASLAKEILRSSDCYVGMRDREEIEASRGLFDLIIWVDASDRLSLEPPSSFNIDKSYADIIIENNGTIAEFTSKAEVLGSILGL